MNARTVTTQAEFDQAVRDRVEVIDIRSTLGVWIYVMASGTATVQAWGTATVQAWGNATVHARGNATVHARGNASVHACDSATVQAWGNATVHARGNASVHACDSATVHACDSATVHASSLVAVHLHSVIARIKGGVTLDHTHINHMDAATWCAYHGVAVKRGVATLYKAVNDQWTTDRGTDYSPGSKPTCDDFRDTDACGNGLHFGPTPIHALTYFATATKFVAVGVKVSELRPINGTTPKAKAPRVVRACVEVDINGKPVQVTP